MSGLFNPFKNNSNNQQDVGDFNLQQPKKQFNPYENETELYQKNLINSKNQGENLIRPRHREFENGYNHNPLVDQFQRFSQNDFNGQNNQQRPLERMMPVYNGNQNHSNPYNNNNNNNRFSNNGQNMHHQNMNNLNMRNQSMNGLSANNYNPNNFRQDYTDFENQNYFDYGRYRDENQYNRMGQQQSPTPMSQNRYHPQPVNNFYNEQPLYEDYQNYNNNMQYGYSEFSNNNQFYNPNNRYNYNPNMNYAPNSANVYNPYEYQTYKNRLQSAKIIPKPIAKEIRSEKFRLLFMFLFGAAGIIVSSIMLAVYYKTGDQPGSKLLGLTRNQVMYPFFSILLLIVAIGFFLSSLTDHTLLYSNVKKYERELLMGSESVPYFITRNYRSLISRSIYLNWISFSTYVVGAIILGILYGLQSQYNTGKTEIYILFWKVGELKSLNSEITIIIIVLFSMLAIHISNIVISRSRKNNIISYYGYEIIPQQEIREIRKKANRKCMIIFFVVLALILFLIIVPWLIIRRKKGKSLKLWGNSN